MKILLQICLYLVASLFAYGAMTPLRAVLNLSMGNSNFLQDLPVNAPIAPGQEKLVKQSFAVFYSAGLILIGLVCSLICFGVVQLSAYSGSAAVMLAILLAHAALDSIGTVAEEKYSIKKSRFAPISLKMLPQLDLMSKCTYTLSRILAFSVMFWSFWTFIGWEVITRP